MTPRTPALALFVAILFPVGCENSHPLAPFDHIVIGHVVINLTTGEVTMLAGRELMSVDALACAAST